MPSPRYWQWWWATMSLGRAAAASVPLGLLLLAQAEPGTASTSALWCGALIGPSILPLSHLAAHLSRDHPSVSWWSARAWAAAVPSLFAKTVIGATDGSGPEFAERMTTPFLLAAVVGLSFCIGAQGALLVVPKDTVANVMAIMLAMTAIKLQVVCTHAYLVLHVACLGSMALGYVCVARYADLHEALRETAEAVVLAAVAVNQPYVVTDDRLRILAVNQRFVDVLDYVPDELYGTPVATLLDGAVDAQWVKSLIDDDEEEHVWSVLTKAGRALPVRITFGETRCPINATKFYWAKFASMALEQRNAQLRAEKEKLQWEVASHRDGEDDPREHLVATPYHALATRDHRTLGPMQDQSRTDEAVSCARSYDHADSRDASPAASPVAPKCSGTDRSVRSARSDASTVATLASSVMDTVSVAAAKDVTRAPQPPKGRRPWRPTKASSEPESSKPMPAPRDHAPTARPLPTVECHSCDDDLREHS